MQRTGLNPPPALVDPAATLSPAVLIKGAGEMASAIAWRLHRSHIRRIVMLDLERPLCVRRTVSFCEALVAGSAIVEGVQARSALTPGAVAAAWSAGCIAVAPTSAWPGVAETISEIVIDAILSKRNLGTSIGDAALVIALGPGFEAGVDCHVVIETQRGHDLGRTLYTGRAQPDTGIPGEIAGHARERVLRAPAAGNFASDHEIGDEVNVGDVFGEVSGQQVRCAIGGVLRGMIRPGTRVWAGLKLGDIDPRRNRDHCWTISDKARAIAGAVLEAILAHCNRARR